MYTFLSFSCALVCACGAAFSQVVINEVLYDPTGTDTGKENIEIRNVGSTVIDLTGYDLYPDGIGYFTFPTASLSPGAIAVVHLRQTGTNTATDYFHSSASLNMGNTSGSVALFNSTTHGAGTLVSFVQWGAGGQSWAIAAVSAGMWTSAADSVPGVSDGHSLEYDGSGFSPGDWFDQAAPTIGSFNALPVQLAAFSGRRVGTSVFLSWETLSEVDNYGFDVERRGISLIDADGHGLDSHNDGVPPATSSPWSKTGFVSGAGSSQVTRRYSFVDPSPPEEATAYRLRQLDRSGSFTFSDIVEIGSISRSESMNLECFPNPFNPSSQVRFSVPADGNARVVIFDAAGREVETIFSGPAKKGISYTLMVDGAKLATGTYFAVCEFGGKRISRKMLLMR